MMINGRSRCKRTRTTNLWLITTKLSVAVCKTLKTNRKLDVGATNDVLNLEFKKFGVEAKFLDNARVLARRQARVVFTLGTSHDHLPRRENECGRLGIANPHDDSGETLCIKGSTRAPDVSN